jgi:NTP pyrophosphatase (non-canonical NTP hydrolase)
MLKSLEEISQRSAEFAKERNWQIFQSPKNLSMALSVEANELLEIFQWMTESESRSLSQLQRQAVSDELADVLLYLVRVADETNINLLEAVSEKIKKNEAKYPIDRVKGRADKYTSYSD